MKKIFAILLLATVFVSGCGTPLIDLTAAESQRIVSYASYVLMKHNDAALKGIVKVPVVQEEEAATTPQVQDDAAAQENLSADEVTDSAENAASADASLAFTAQL